jgi:hypothetical protein
MEGVDLSTVRELMGHSGIKGKCRVKCYIFVYTDDESAILLAAFKEHDARDYETAIARASRIYSELEED